MVLTKELLYINSGECEAGHQSALCSIRWRALATTATQRGRVMMGAFLDRSRIVARPGWSRWLVPPAALSIHLAIGSAYAWRVFKIPLESALGISGTASALPFTIGVVMLGLSAAVFVTRVDHKGPRWALHPRRLATVAKITQLFSA